MSTFLALVALAVMALSLYKQANANQPKAIRIKVRDEGTDYPARRRR